MKFRPCIDIHNGAVKQIVGGSLKDQGNCAGENFVSSKGSAYYADLYRQNHLFGGHVILLNAKDSEYFERTKELALEALRAFPNGLQVGGGITPYNAEEYLKNGASHVIVTSYVFCDGKLHEDRLKEMLRAVGKEKLVLDLSCRRNALDNAYYIVTDRWQKFTSTELTSELLEQLSDCCDEFLIHAVDVEGKQQGIEKDVVAVLKKAKGNPITYAGGVHSFEDLKVLKEQGEGKIDVTIGSALSVFGGGMDFDEVVRFCKS